MRTITLRRSLVALFATRQLPSLRHQDLTQTWPLLWF